METERERELQRKLTEWRCIVGVIVWCLLLYACGGQFMPDCSGRQQPMEGRCYLDPMPD